MKTRHVHTLGCKGTNNWHKNKIKAPQSDYFFVFPSWKSAFSHTPPVLCAIIFQHQPTLDCRQAYTQLQTNLHSIANKPTFDCRQAHADCFYLKHCTCNISAFLASHIRSGRQGGYLSYGKSCESFFQTTSIKYISLNHKKKTWGGMAMLTFP